MKRDTIAVRPAERGSALVIATLVVVIMTLLGISFLMMAQTENRIAENEKLSAQALYFAEAGARTVKRWFDRPRSTSSAIFAMNLDFPTVSQVRRDLRQIDVDGDGPTAAVLTDGNAAGSQPYYKHGVDRNGDGVEDLFEKPYRADPLNTFYGTASGPDIRISRADSSAAKTFLDGLSDKLIAGFPAAGVGISARIHQIDVYSAPYISIAGTWTRYGVATIAVTAQIIKTVATTESVLAQRTVRAVINETPYPGPFGPFHSCNQLNFGGDLNMHWGTVTGSGPDISDLPNNMAKLWTSIPRDIPPSVKAEAYWDHTNPTTFAAIKANLEAGKTIQDPWFRVITGGDIADFVGSPSQVFTPAAPYDEDHSNIFKQLSPVPCPEFDYETWKTVAQSGGSDVHYYTWVTGEQYAENGSGTPTDFKALTSGKTGLYFFDTTNKGEPTDTNSDGRFENLTPAINLQGGSWGGMRGFLYVNTDTLTVNGTANQGMNATFTLPGEPYRDADGDGAYDAGEDYINLNYNSLVNITSAIGGAAGDRFPASNASGTPPSYNTLGPQFTDKTLFWGILYTSGEFDSQGTPRFLGSIITKTGQTKSAGTVDVYWDPTIVDNWPPSDWEMPRVVITRWETDL